MDNINLNIQLINKNKILNWSKLPVISATLNYLFREFIKITEINNYELTIDKDIIYSKFVSLVYYMNIL